MKAILRDAIPTVPIIVKAMGRIHFIYSDRGVHVISELANEAVNDLLQLPYAIIDKIRGDIIEQVCNYEYIINFYFVKAITTTSLKCNEKPHVAFSIIIERNKHDAVCVLHSSLYELQ